MTIGEVVETLAPSFPDLSISKVRFLEEEGLISPERTPGGYRKFTEKELARIELVLRLQKEYFMPLAVIRGKIAEYERGNIPPELRESLARSVGSQLPFADEAPIRLNDAQSLLGIPESYIRELAEFGLVEITQGEGGERIGPMDQRIAQDAWEVRRFGFEPRHLRMYETFAEREAAFFAQVLTPAFRHRTPETRQRLVEAIRELMGMTSDLRSNLLRRSLARVFEDIV